jgi:hypothetical protein
MVEQRAIEVLHDEWQKFQAKKERGEVVEQGLRTERVYRRLLEEEWDVPGYMLTAFGQIRGQKVDDGDGMKLHGAMLITWANPNLLEDTQRREDDSFYWPA